MDKNDETDRCVDSRRSGGNYHGLERRRCLGQGKFVMANVYRWTFYGILLFNIILSISVLNLTVFAKKGPRYTADDGAKERAERIQADQDLHARIDALHRNWNKE